MAPSLIEPTNVAPDMAPAPATPETQLTPASGAPTPALFSLARRTTLVTGAARGLGLVLARALVESGSSVVCLDVLAGPESAAWAGVEKAAAAAGAHAMYLQADITNEAAVAGAVGEAEALAARTGMPLAGAVACAAVQQQVPGLEYDPLDFERVLRVNVVGTFLTAKHAALSMRRNGVPGSIVLVASMSGRIANRGLSCSAYNSSKAAVHQLCRSLAQEWGQYGIRINTLSPGYIRTAMTDQLLEMNPAVEKTWMAGSVLGRLGAPEDFKAPTVFLLAPGSSFMTGSDLRVDGGVCASA